MNARVLAGAAVLSAGWLAWLVAVAHFFARPALEAIGIGALSGGPLETAWWGLDHFSSGNAEPTRKLAFFGCAVLPPAIVALSAANFVALRSRRRNSRS